LASPRSAIDPSVEPTVFDTRAPDLVVVTVSQTVRSLDRIVVSHGVVLHTYRLVEHEISEMTIESAEQCAVGSRLPSFSTTE
jgi:hypothetical protein